MLYLIKFLLISQIFKVLTFTNHSTIHINNGPIKASYETLINGAALSGNSYKSYQTKMTESEQIKFNRVKKKILSEFKDRSIYKLDRVITEVYESSYEYWITLQEYDDELITLYIFEVTGKYMDVYEYELTERLLDKLLKKKNLEKNQDLVSYFIENK